VIVAMLDDSDFALIGLPESMLALHTTHLERHWKGVDPYDFVWKLSKLLPARYGEPLYYVIDGYLGLSLTDSSVVRKVMGIEPHHDAKALAVFARAYSLLDDRGPVHSSTQFAVQLCRLVWSLRNQKTHYPSWGLSFPWRTSIGQVLPANSPTSLITSLAGLAFLEAHLKSRIDDFLEYSRLCAQYLVEENGFSEDSRGICFYYSPLVSERITNASAIVAMFLNSLARVTADRELRGLSDRAYEFVVNTQHSYGGWNYFPDRETRLHLVDNYHTGFILESLLRYTGPINERVKRASINGITFYTKMFTSQGVPINSLGSRYPIDAHDFAQGLIVFSLGKSSVPGAGQLLQRIWSYGRSSFLKPDGTFRSRIYRYGRSAASFPRWADAWIFLGMTEAYRSLLPPPELGGDQNG